MCLPLLAPLARWTVSTEMGALLQGDQRSLAAYAQAREILGEHEAVLVSLEQPDLFSPASLALVAQVSEALAGLPGVIEIKSLTHAVQPVRRGFGFAMVPLLPDPPWDAARRAAFRDFCLSHPLVRNVMVAADGRHTVLTVTFAERPTTVAAQAAFNARLEAALAPFRVAGVPLNSVTVMVGALALGVAVDDTVHLLTHWQRPRRAGLPPREALVAALAVKGPPIIWTSVVLTGVCGLFGLSAFPPVAQFGLLLAGAFVAALGAVLVLLPAWWLTRAD